MYRERAKKMYLQLPHMSSSLMKTSFKKGESGGLINRYMTI